MKTLMLAACLLSTVAVSPVLAANATRPYQNCDRKIDNCGPTGDNKSDDLNAQQLGGNSGQPAPAQTGPNGAPVTGTQR